MSQSGGEKALVRLKDVSVQFRNNRVLSECTLGVTPGQVVELRGTNGSGKTTLLRVLAGVTQPTQGTRIGPPTCAYIPADVGVLPMRVDEWLQVMAKQRAIDPRELLARLAFDSPLSALVRHLSFGNFRKLLLAEAFSSNERLIVVDEATNGLDDHGISGLADMVHRAAGRGAAVVIADQASSLGLGGSASWIVEGGHVHSVAIGKVDVSFDGPAEQLPALLAEAKRLGFRRIAQ